MGGEVRKLGKRERACADNSNDARNCSVMDELQWGGGRRNPSHSLLAECEGGKVGSMQLRKVKAVAILSTNL